MDHVRSLPERARRPPVVGPNQHDRREPADLGRRRPSRASQSAVATRSRRTGPQASRSCLPVSTSGPKPPISRFNGTQSPVLLPTRHTSGSREGRHSLGSGGAVQEAHIGVGLVGTGGRDRHKRDAPPRRRATTPDPPAHAGPAGRAGRAAPAGRGAHESARRNWWEDRPVVSQRLRTSPESLRSDPRPSLPGLATSEPGSRYRPEDRSPVRPGGSHLPLRARQKVPAGPLRPQRPYPRTCRESRPAYPRLSHRCGRHVDDSPTRSVRFTPVHAGSRRIRPRHPRPRRAA
jgi:hypothetical protein